MKKELKNRKFRNLYLEILMIEIVLLFFLFLFLSPLFIKIVIADIGENVTIVSGLDVGSSAPIINLIDIEGGSITLIPNSTKAVNCTVEITDYDTEVDIETVTAEFFDNTNSFYGDSDDNNYHYTNTSCYIDTSYGDGNTALAHCLFDVWYYANSDTWNCTANVSDYRGYNVIRSNTTMIETLLSIGLPDTINYGLINATFVSNESIANVTNYGNVMINLSLSGYANSVGDGWAMNCTLGGNISIDYEKYNLTASTSGILNLTEFENSYINLTSSPVTKKFNLAYRQNDNINEATNETYWRIYVPLGVGGECQGNIVFGAVQAPGS